MTFVRSCCCSVRIFSISRVSVDWMIRRIYTTFNQKYYPVHNCTPCLLKRKIFQIRNRPANTVSPLISEIPSKLYSYQQHASTHHSNQDVHMKQFENSYKLVEDEFLMLNNDIKKLIYTIHPDLQEIAHYHLDGRGKSLRPMTVMLMAKSCNFHHIGDSTILHSQYVIAMISEMIHIASLMHDDVIDQSDIRRGKPSVKAVWGERKAVFAGNFILGSASSALAKLKNEYVISVISCVIEDLVKGEFMQLGSKEDETERFNHYLTKSFKKTASLIANSCKAVAIFGNCCDDIVNTAYLYGRHIGLAFQLVDDLLDFVACDKTIGKPTAADLRLGLATAPVLFAAQQYPELHPLIMRRFKHEGDVEKARDLVVKSDGVAHTRLLAEQHAKEAISMAKKLKHSASQQALINLVEFVLHRKK
ncbi:all trans-polyprenyl-diphosphate synthase PDSS1 isoform X1 [Octopus bimaculoides]|uniref:All trans-polyprenyl-diphosphate synthase PDSS1 n=2 Tax=Octopus bimaculoides TaxID=37653 RepID=A0A0L8HA08_OCTBM|nr:all trans-polyprenyl-diphosphate synthase PDSS1 isoform X1 [Octopus bimaculoides]|eukprot:XP_014774209.1 PREDICTED: decaprenyl-diphosphate synthase subunit 1-like isoform X1 [Octopus bimaculoides]